MAGNIRPAGNHSHPKMAILRERGGKGSESSIERQTKGEYNKSVITTIEILLNEKWEKVFKGLGIRDHVLIARATDRELFIWSEIGKET